MLFLLATLLLPACAPADPVSTELDAAFHDASAEYDVPYEVLAGTSWALTRWNARDGAVNSLSGVGIMDLRVEGGAPSLVEAAALIGADTDDVNASTRLSIEASAALMHEWALESEKLTGEKVDGLQAWYPIVARWSGADDPLVAEGFAGQVYDMLQAGIMATTDSGEVINIPPQPMSWRRQLTTGSSTVDQFVPASSSNYTNGSRTSIKYVIIHTTEGSYSGAISWFQNSSAQVSAHYIVRSSDGQITQGVQEEDIAWHAGYWTYNSEGIGIEHEGYVSDPGKWYTDAMYQNSADLTRDICDRYGIPKDRAHIIGHFEVPGCSNPGGGGSGCHTDPGSGWDWDRYIALVNGSTTPPQPTNNGADGPRHGRFDAKFTSAGYGMSDSCSGDVQGAVNGGQVYLSATCTLDKNGDKTGKVVWSGNVSGTTWTGKMVVEGHSANLTGQVASDGSLSLKMTGSEDLSGDVGVLDYTLTLSAAP